MIRRSVVMAAAVTLVAAVAGPARAQAKVSSATLPAARTAAVKWRFITGTFVDLTAGVEAAPSRFTGRVDSVLNVEAFSFNSAYRLKAGVFVGARAGVRIRRHLVVGLGASVFSRDATASTSAQLPHPFYFGETRPVSGSAGGLARENLGIHFECGWAMPLGPRTEAVVFAGPSVLRVSQDLITRILFSDSYPYDTAVFTGVQSSTARKTAIGFNFGADLTHMLSTTTGAGVLVRYSRASLSMQAAEDQGTKTASTIVGGGLQVGAFVRFRF